MDASSRERQDLALTLIQKNRAINRKEAIRD